MWKVLEEVLEILNILHRSQVGTVDGEDDARPYPRHVTGRVVQMLVTCLKCFDIPLLWGRHTYMLDMHGRETAHVVLCPYTIYSSTGRTVQEVVRSPLAVLDVTYGCGVAPHAVYGAHVILRRRGVGDECWERARTVMLLMCAAAALFVGKSPRDTTLAVFGTCVHTRRVSVYSAELYDMYKTWRETRDEKHYVKFSESNIPCRHVLHGTYSIDNIVNVIQLAEEKTVETSPEFETADEKLLVVYDEAITASLVIGDDWYGSISRMLKSVVDIARSTLTMVYTATFERQNTAFTVLAHVDTRVPSLLEERTRRKR